MHSESNRATWQMKHFAMYSQPCPSTSSSLFPKAPSSWRPQQWINQLAAVQVDVQTETLHHCSHSNSHWLPQRIEIFTNGIKDFSPASSPLSPHRGFSVHLYTSSALESPSVCMWFCHQTQVESGWQLNFTRMITLRTRSINKSSNIIQIHKNSS